MTSARLIHRIRWQRRIEAQNASGQAVEEYEDIKTTWAGLKPITGREYYNASGERGTITHEIEIHFDPTLQLRHKDRGLLGDRVFDIQSAVNVGEANHTLLIRVVEHAR